MRSRREAAGRGVEAAEADRSRAAVAVASDFPAAEAASGFPVAAAFQAASASRAVGANVFPAGRAPSAAVAGSSRRAPAAVSTVGEAAAFIEAAEIGRVAALQSDAFILA